MFARTSQVSTWDRAFTTPRRRASLCLVLSASIFLSVFLAVSVYPSRCICLCIYSVFLSVCLSVSVFVSICGYLTYPRRAKDSARENVSSVSRRAGFNFPVVLYSVNFSSPRRRFLLASFFAAAWNTRCCIGHECRVSTPLVHKATPPSGAVCTPGGVLPGVQTAVCEKWKWSMHVHSVHPEPGQ